MNEKQKSYYEHVRKDYHDKIRLKIREDGLISRISSGLLVAAILVFIHSFFYPGSGFFNVNEANYSTQIWLISNLVLSSTILYAVYNIKKPNKILTKTSFIGVVFAIYNIDFSFYFISIRNTHNRTQIK